jgi:hypothetical protein
MKRTTVRATIASLVFLSLSSPARAADAPVVSNAWARATAPGAEMGAAYLTLEAGANADMLKAASTPRARTVEIHTVEHVDGVAKMRRVEAVELPAGKRVALAPGGMHLMLFGLASPLVAGERFELQLEFADAGSRTISVEVRPATSTGDQSSHQR